MPASSTTACRFAPWPMPCSRPATRPTCRSCGRSRSACRPPRPRRRCFPPSSRAASHPGPCPTLTTMDRRLQSAYSRQGSVEVEQQIGERGTVSAGYHYVRGERLLMSINQNVPSCVASGTNNGCRPNPELREQQPVLVGRHVHLSRPARVAAASAGALGPVPRVVHAVEGDEQRRRVLLQLADRSLRSVEGLGPLRQRPAPPAGRQRHGAHAGWTRRARRGST